MAKTISIAKTDVTQVVNRACPAPASNSYWLLYNEGVDLNLQIMFDLFVFLIVQRKREPAKSTLITPL